MIVETTQNCPRGRTTCGPHGRSTTCYYTPGSSAPCLQGGRHSKPNGGEPSVGVDSNSLASPIPALACTLITSRAVLCQCLSRIALLHCPHAHRRPASPAHSEAPHQQAQLHELPCLVGLCLMVQFVVLSCTRMRRLRLSEQRLTHQAYDQPVALDGAHTLLQLEQDLVLVLDIAAFRLPIGEGSGSGL